MADWQDFFGIADWQDFGSGERARGCGEAADALRGIDCGSR